MLTVIYTTIITINSSSYKVHIQKPKQILYSKQYAFEFSSSRITSVRKHFRKSLVLLEVRRKAEKSAYHESTLFTLENIKGNVDKQTGWMDKSALNKKGIKLPTKRRSIKQS